MFPKSLLPLGALLLTALPLAAAAPPVVPDDVASSTESKLVAKHGEAARARLHRGLGQVRQFWRAEDGDAAAYAAFCEANFVSSPAELDEMFARYERLLESVEGHLAEIRRDLRWQQDLDLGPIRPYDELWGNLSPSAHLSEDYFRTKVAFVALLNFPLTTLDERLKDGPGWSRRQWAEARLASRFARRVPASVGQEIDRAFSASSDYIAGWNLWMNHVLAPDGKRLFPEGMRLLTHWNLRDQIKADYADPNGLPKQRLIQQVMEKIVRQEVPKAAIDNPLVDWTPATGKLAAAPPTSEKAPAGKLRPSGAVPADFEGDERYVRLASNFRAMRLADPYSPNLPTFIARKFEEDREIPEAEVRRLLEEVLSSPAVPKVAALIRQRLGRPLEPFDIWYAGFRPRSAYSEAELDKVVREKYPTVAAFQADVPTILRKLGFAPETADFVASRIEVDPARGSGHAMAAERRGDKAHLRTRIPEGGMNYKGYNIAVHELGHNVEQTFSLERIDHWLLKSVPNNAFTEALAFVFQSRDLELLGLRSPSPDDRRLAALDDFWGAFEISGVAMVDIGIWRWMYEHPEATPADVKEATLRIAKETWNRWYAPVFGKKDVPLLAIYSHMIDEGMYLPDYPLGHLIAFQIERQFEGKSLATEFERVTRQGSVTPDLWMKGATGSPISAKPLVDAAVEAAGALGASKPGKK